MSVPADTRVWSECRTLAEAGFEVFVVCPRGTTRDRETFELRDGVEIHRFDSVEAQGGLFGYAAEYLLALWHISCATRRLARARRFDVVHAANPPDLLLLAALPLKARGTRLIFDQHDLVPELYLSRFATRRSPMYWFTRALERSSFALADLVIAPNNSYRDLALKRGRKAPSDVVVVRNGPDPDVFRPPPGNPALPAGKPHLVVYVGTMNAQDGVDHAVRALSILKKTRTDWLAVFVGDGDARPAAEQLVDELGLGKLVEFTGLLDRSGVIRTVSAATVCLSPEPPSPLNNVSTFIKIAEYMALERPVVAYDLPESRFTAGAAAAYATPDDVEDFARMIDELLDDPARRAAMGRDGRARIVSSLSWERSKPALEAAYARVLAMR